jgi:3-oxoacyl-[acyl-carrier protein] reductase
MNDLKNKVVLITGASSGIGAAAALAFGRYGARVAVHYRSQRDAALSVVAQIQAAGASAEAFGCDVMDSTQLVRLVQAVHARFGRIDVLINNAGIIGDLGPLWELSTALVSSVLILDILANFLQKVV